MLRSFRPLALALALIIPGCGGDKVSGTPSAIIDSRTVASMLPYITKSLTPTLAEQRFGAPDAFQRTGTVVMIYKVENESTVSLGFPSLDQSITFARLTDKAGVVTTLPIKD